MWMSDFTLVHVVHLLALAFRFQPHPYSLADEMLGGCHGGHLLALIWKAGNGVDDSQDPPHYRLPCSGAEEKLSVAWWPWSRAPQEKIQDK